MADSDAVRLIGGRAAGVPRPRAPEPGDPTTGARTSGVRTSGVPAQRARGGPTSRTTSRPTAAQATESVLRHLTGLTLPLGLRCWDGSRIAGPAGSPTLVVRAPQALRRVLFAPGELGLARAYVSGELDVEGDLFVALELLDGLLARPGVHVDRRALAPLLGTLLRMGVLGLPPRPPVEEARLTGQVHSKVRDQQAVSHHYDAGNDFYALLLGPSMVYSCAFFDSPSTSLDDAQTAKLEMVCRKLDLRPGMRLLDVGCGWGSLAVHAASRYGVQVVGVTLSAAQAELARSRVAAEGVQDRVQIRLQGYRDVTDGPFDAISSIGMAEHVGEAELPGYATTLATLLRPGGLLLNQAIARGPCGSGDRTARDAFLTRYVFPDGELQPLAQHVAVLEEAGFEVRDVEAMREHYARTCREWVARLEQQWGPAVRCSSAGRARVWRLYLAGSALAFEARRVGVNQILAVRP